MSRRRARESLLHRMKTWHLVLVFCIAAGTLGAAILAFVGRVEREYGPIAAWLGLAPRQYVVTEIATHKAEHKIETTQILNVLADVQSEQLFDRIGRLERQIAEQRKKPNLSWMEERQLRESEEELRRVKVKYERLQGRP
jgi:hypothetical protein